MTDDLRAALAALDTVKTPDSSVAPTTLIGEARDLHLALKETPDRPLRQHEERLAYIAARGLAIAADPIGAERLLPEPRPDWHPLDHALARLVPPPLGVHGQSALMPGLVPDTRTSATLHLPAWYLVATPPERPWRDADDTRSPAAFHLRATVTGLPDGEIGLRLLDPDVPVDRPLARDRHRKPDCTRLFAWISRHAGFPVPEDNGGERPAAWARIAAAAPAAWNTLVGLIPPHVTAFLRESDNLTLHGAAVLLAPDPDQRARRLACRRDHPALMAYVLRTEQHARAAADVKQIQGVERALAAIDAGEPADAAAAALPGAPVAIAAPKGRKAKPATRAALAAEQRIQRLTFDDNRTDDLCIWSLGSMDNAGPAARLARAAIRLWHDDPVLRDERARDPAAFLVRLTRTVHHALVLGADDRPARHRDHAVRAGYARAVPAPLILAAGAGGPPDAFPEDPGRTVERLRAFLADAVLPHCTGVHARTFRIHRMNADDRKNPDVRDWLLKRDLQLDERLDLAALMLRTWLQPADPGTGDADSLQPDLARRRDPAIAATGWRAWTDAWRDLRRASGIPGGAGDGPLPFPPLPAAVDLPRRVRAIASAPTFETAQWRHRGVGHREDALAVGAEYAFAIGDPRHTSTCTIQIPRTHGDEDRAYPERPRIQGHAAVNSSGPSAADRRTADALLEAVATAWADDPEAFNAAMLAGGPGDTRADGAEEAPGDRWDRLHAPSIPAALAPLAPGAGLVDELLQRCTPAWAEAARQAAA